MCSNIPGILHKCYGINLFFTYIRGSTACSFYVNGFVPIIGNAISITYAIPVERFSDSGGFMGQLDQCHG